MIAARLRLALDSAVVTRLLRQGDLSMTVAARWPQPAFFSTAVAVLDAEVHFHSIDPVEVESVLSAAGLIAVAVEIGHFAE